MAAPFNYVETTAIKFGDSLVRAINTQYGELYSWDDVAHIYALSELSRKEWLERLHQLEPLFQVFVFACDKRHQPCPNRATFISIAQWHLLSRYAAISDIVRFRHSFWLERVAQDGARRLHLGYRSAVRTYGLNAFRK